MQTTTHALSPAVPLSAAPPEPSPTPAPSAEPTLPAPPPAPIPITTHVTARAAHGIRPVPEVPPDALLARLLEGKTHEDTELSLRLCAALLLCAIYGGAIGVGAPWLDLARHVAGVPLIFVANLALGLPALAIGLSFMDARITPRELAQAAVDAVSAAGVAFAGLAPVAAFFAISSAGRPRAVIVTTLLVGLVIAITRFTKRTFSLLYRGGGLSFSQLGIGLVYLGFATALSLRVVVTSLPIF